MQKLFLLISSIRFNLWLKYSVAAVLLIIPLYPKFPILTVPGTYVAIRAEDFLISILGVVFFFYFLKTSKKEFFSDKVHLAIFIFILSGLVSLIGAIFLTQTVSWQIGLLHWARRVEYLVPFFVAYSAVRSGVGLRYYFHLLILIGFLAFLYGFGQEHFGFPVITTQNEEYSKGIALRWVSGARLPSTFAGHYDLAAFLVMSFPLIFAYLFYLKSKGKKLLLVFGYLLPVFWLFLQTEARVSFVAAIVGVVTTLWLVKRKKYIVWILVTSLVGMLFFSSLGARYLRTINFYRAKIVGFSTQEVIKIAKAYEDNRTLNQTSAPPPGEDRSFSIRIHVEWPRAIRAFLKNPLFGTGYSSLGLAADNDYLRLLGEVGLVGALAFFVLILRVIEGMKRRIKNISSKFTVRKAFVAGYIGSLAGFLANAMFIDVFEASKVAIIFWTLSGIAAAIARKHSGND